MPAPPAKVGEIIARHLKAGELDTATQVFREAAAHGVPATASRLVRSSRRWSAGASFDRARTFLGELRTAGTLTHGRHYGSLIGAFLKAGRPDDAVELLRQMLATRIEPTTSDASRVATALVKANQLDAAAALIDELSAKGVHVDEPTYRELMWAYAQTGKADETKAVFDRLVAAGSPRMTVTTRRSSG